METLSYNFHLAAVEKSGGKKNETVWANVYRLKTDLRWKTGSSQPISHDDTRKRSTEITGDLISSCSERQNATACREPSLQRSNRRNIQRHQSTERCKEV